MKQDLLTYIPPEIIIEILSRLPIRSIIRCKCVCKSWLDLIKSNEFVNSHLSKSVPGLALFEGICYPKSRPKPYKFLEFVENSMHIVFNSSFPHDPHKYIHSSVNGLLLLSNPKVLPRDLNIYNPITRDYIKLPRPHAYPSPQFQAETFGFGVSKKIGQYKVVRLSHECMPPRGSDFFWKTDVSEAKCEVYTLGTGSWRIINELNVPLRYKCDYNTAATFLNGNLHWWGRAFHDDSLSISCFDLETEVFSIFSGPPIHGCSAISALEECLVVCDTALYVDEIVIWFMNEYGDDKSWTKNFIITRSWSPSPDDYYTVLLPIKVLENGDILISGWHYSRLLSYSNKAKTVEEADLAELYGYESFIGVVSYTPSFVPLNTFTMETYAVLEHGEAEGEVMKVCEASSSEKV